MSGSPFLTWFFALSSLFLAVGCRPANAEKKPLAEPPYRVRPEGQLAVRSDLFAKLTFATVSASEQRASLAGFGRAAFAPGGAYAVRAPGSAFVERVLVAVGDHVQAGQTLAVLRSSEVARMRADVRRLSVLIKAEEAALGRIEQVIAQGAAPAREAAELRAKIAGERAELAGAEGALSALRAGNGGGDYVELRATQAGHVLSRAIAPGERVSESAADPAFLIGDPTRLVVKGSFSERDAPFLSREATCSFSAPALGSERFTGVVTHVGRVVDPRTQTLEILCAPTKGEPRLSPDMSVQVEVAVGSGGVLLVPRSAVLLRKDDRVVFVRAGEGMLARRAVQLGLSLRDSVQILDGLTAGDEVVTKNAILLDGELDEVL